MEYQRHNLKTEKPQKLYMTSLKKLEVLKLLKMNSEDKHHLLHHHRGEGYLLPLLHIAQVLLLLLLEEEVLLLLHLQELP